MLNLPCSCNNKDISKSLLALLEVLLISIHFCTCIFNCLSLVWMVVKDFNLVSKVELVLRWLRLRLWIYGKLKQRYIKSTENSSPAFTNFFSLIFLDETRILSSFTSYANVPSASLRASCRPTHLLESHVSGQMLKKEETEEGEIQLSSFLTKSFNFKGMRYFTVLRAWISISIPWT